MRRDDVLERERTVAVARERTDHEVAGRVAMSAGHEAQGSVLARQVDGAPIRERGDEQPGQVAERGLDVAHPGQGPRGLLQQAEAAVERLRLVRGQLERLRLAHPLAKPGCDQPGEQRDYRHREQAGGIGGGVVERQAGLGEEVEAVENGDGDAHQRRENPARVRGIDHAQEQDRER